VHPLFRLRALVLNPLRLWLWPADRLHPLLRLLALILYPLGFTLWPLRPLCCLRWLDRLDPLLVFCPLLSYPAAWCGFRPAGLFKLRRFALWPLLLCIRFCILLLAVRWS
jgi:hypothetical protein